ncbi:glycosyltransferase family 9 protein [Persicitalea jodogahamensis]|uniref:ADP-heptosyltransferase n=1 Tax=Persicitalea jodogahamensis TaxID=402147 RepID=A0A8J3DBN1_9BACT|nr:glycosyltransferase family 9 protein [Persicitalea jodogahamensis]GHB80252.1 ADP-heptosyltransferase [Persicitalea jodogahamensis]
MPTRKILIIQTAFLGDAILATSLLESLHRAWPEAHLDLLVRKGHEALFDGHPYLHEVLTWNKKENRYRNLWALLGGIRERRYDRVITLQRFASTGLLTALSGAEHRMGFKKNPFSFTFTHAQKHILQAGTHEVERNFSLIEEWIAGNLQKPRLYPTPADYARVKAYQNVPYICVAPASVWFTKQYPAERWIELLQNLPSRFAVRMLGSPADFDLGQKLIETSGLNERALNLCGQLSFLESAALMQGAAMNYVNDSAPMHMASALNAPVCAVYCSTVPAFGFGPLSDESFVVERKGNLSCRPCGLHGHRACPEGHFRCALEIKTSQLTGIIQ